MTTATHPDIGPPTPAPANSSVGAGSLLAIGGITAVVLSTRQRRRG